MDHLDLLLGERDPDVGRIARDLVLGADREQGRGQSEPDGAAGDLEHVGDATREARLRLVERADSGGGDGGIEEAGTDAGCKQPGNEGGVARARIE